MAAPPRPRLVDRNDGTKPRELPVGSVVLGRYTIQKILGRGGMATVYLARHQQTERLVALKLLDPEISRDPSYVERFRREARAAGRIRSDYVVAIYDLDAEVGGGLVLVMEYLEGQTVQQALRGGRLPIQKVLSFGRHLLEGLAAAHAASVIHRDLKPANLFIERSSTGSEKCKILDFGISKLADASQQELTRDGQTLGTVAYMAPEQIRGKASSTDPRVDLYAAGVTLFIMFSGKRPIDADDTVQLLAAVLENPPITLSQATGVPFPQPLEDFFVRALQKNPDHRFQSAIEMRDALVEAGRTVGYEATGVLQVPAVASAPIHTVTGPHRTPGVDSTPAGSRSGVVPSRSATLMGPGAPPGARPPSIAGVPSVSSPGMMAPPPSSMSVPSVSSPGMMAPPPSPLAMPALKTTLPAQLAIPPSPPPSAMPPGMSSLMTVPHQVPAIAAAMYANPALPPGEITEAPPVGTSGRMKLALLLAALGTSALVATAVVLTLRAQPSAPPAAPARASAASSQSAPAVNAPPAPSTPRTAPPPAATNAPGALPGPTNAPPSVVAPPPVAPNTAPAQAVRAPEPPATNRAPTARESGTTRPASDPATEANTHSGSASRHSTAATEATAATTAPATGRSDGATTRSAGTTGSTTATTGSEARPGTSSASGSGRRRPRRPGIVEDAPF